MNDLYVAFMIITTRGTNFFEFDGDIFQKMDVLEKTEHAVTESR